MCRPMRWDRLWPGSGPLLWINCEDVITCRTEQTGLGPHEVEFQLQFDEPALTWWKGIRVVTHGDFFNPERQWGTSEVQDDVRSGAVLRFSVEDIRPHRLQVWKAKLFGVHTCMYELDLGEMPETFRGHRVVFGWFRDDGPRDGDGPCP